MKKLLLVPVVAAVAAISSASAAGFAGGVSAGPLQTGSTDDLTCASSAKVVAWGTNDHLNPPNVANALVELTGDCSGQAIHLITLTPAGGEQARAASAFIAPQPAGKQYARVYFPAGNLPAVTDVNAVRISVDPGYNGLSNAPTS